MISIKFFAIFVVFVLSSVQSAPLPEPGFKHHEHYVIHVPYKVHHHHHHHVEKVPIFKEIPVIKHVPIYKEVHVPVPIYKEVHVPYHHHEEHHHEHKGWSSGWY